MNNLRKITFLEEDYFDIARENMVSRQLVPFGVTHPALLKAFLTIPRELFLEEPDRQMAYTDSLKRLPRRGFLLPPHFLGRLLNEANLDGQGKTLVIGGGAGYSSAILSSTMSLVFLLENHKHLITKADHYMRVLGIDNVIPVEGPLGQGLARHGTYDVVLIEGAAETIPHEILKQISVGGVLLTFLARNDFVKEAVCLKKLKTGWEEKSIFEGNVPVLQAFSHPKDPVF